MQMPRKSQSTFFDMAIQQRGGSNLVLETIAREVDFGEVETRVAATYGTGGRPASRVGVLVRIMILQHLYNLSDPQAEQQILDRLSFQKFVQLDAQETVPDETTICRFRQRLIECDLHKELLAILNGQLEARGYIVKRTTLVDATLLESSRKHPNAGVARAGQAPDGDARYTRKYHKTYYGYKAHVVSDAQHQLVRHAVISAANANEADWLPQVTPLDTKSLYGDKAYDTKANKAWLKERGIRNQIAKKGAHHIKLTKRDHADNRRKSKVRNGIERIFAHWKRWQGYGRARYVGLVRNQLELTLKAVAYNLKRLVAILTKENA